MDIQSHQFVNPLRNNVTSANNGFTMALRSFQLKRSASRTDNLQCRKAIVKHYRQGGTGLLPRWRVCRDCQTKVLKKFTMGLQTLNLR